MDYRQLLDIEVSDLSSLDEKTRENIIKAGSVIYLEEVKLTAKLLEFDYDELLKSSILFTEHQIQIETLQENYELCYFLNKILNKVKEEYYGLQLWKNTGTEIKSKN
jgi:hypothetical protein